MDFAEIKPSFWNFLLLGAMIGVVVPFFKFLFATIHVPGLSDLYASV